MPAKHLYRVSAEKTYSHIYNRGIEKRVIFGDKEDYEVFKGFLKDYLSAPNPESIKKTFTVKGRKYRGTPHQPKNHFGKVELTAYSLMPDHFHLLLHQVESNAIEKFVRSLCTRYSIYFNKKYQRTGPLFEGPYKSVHVEDDKSLHLLTRHFHQVGPHSSLPEYLGDKETSWVKPKKGQENYKNFMEGRDLNTEEQDLLDGVSFDTHEEAENQELERRILPSEAPKNSSRPKVFGYAVSTVVFFVLLGIGLKNIQASENGNLASSVLSESTNSPASESLQASPTPSPELAEIAIVKITDESDFVNIRTSPDISSEKIGEALDGQVFEIVSKDSKWFGVKLENGSTGFISTRYIEIKLK